jgi:hypothetical protein
VLRVRAPSQPWPSPSPRFCCIHRALVCRSAVITVFGQILHVAEPFPRDPQDVGNGAGEFGWLPLPPPIASPTAPPPLPEGAPSLPPAAPRPPLAPPPVPPPTAWYQRRLPITLELINAQVELALGVLLCLVAPAVYVAHQRYKKRRQAQQALSIGTELPRFDEGYAASESGSSSRSAAR